MIIIPRDLERKILEFAGFKLRNGIYIKQLDINPKIQELLLDRPHIENDKVTIGLYYKKYHNSLVLKCIEINEEHESYTCYYDEDFDGTRYEYEPFTPW